MKLHLFRYYKTIIVFYMVFLIILVYPVQIFAEDTSIPQNSQVEATISKDIINVVIKKEDMADIITITAMPYIIEAFVGYNFVHPGLKKEGILEIRNETGEAYKVIDYNLTAEIAYLKRIYNAAAESYFGPASPINYEKVTALSGDEWYQRNADYFGEENFSDMNVLRKMFGWGDWTQGIALSGYETGQKMIDLGFQYLFQNCVQFSFNTNSYPVNNYDTKNIHILDYINKTEPNKELMLNQFFADKIEDEGLSMKIGYSMDNDSIGNAYNSAYADFGFELILERIADKEIESIEPETPESEPDAEPEKSESEPDAEIEKPESEPGAKPETSESKSDIAKPKIVGKSNFSDNTPLIIIDEAPSAPEIIPIPDEKAPLEKNPDTGMPDNMLSVSLLLAYSGLVILIFKKQ